MNDISKLPKWAQDKIKELERQRLTAINALNQYCDSQTPSPFYIDEYESTGEGYGPSSKRRYIQTYKIEVVHQGVWLSVSLREDCINLQWGNGPHKHNDVAFIPHSYQNARIVSKENMR